MPGTIEFVDEGDFIKIGGHDTFAAVDAYVKICTLKEAKDVCKKHNFTGFVSRCHDHNTIGERYFRMQRPTDLFASAGVDSNTDVYINEIWNQQLQLSPRDCVDHTSASVLKGDIAFFVNGRVNRSKSNLIQHGYLTLDNDQHIVTSSPAVTDGWLTMCVCVCVAFASVPSRL
jgi:hypothetical protein